MAKVFYIEHPEGNFYSVDKSKRYISLSGKELIKYLESPEGKTKRFYIEDDIGVEIPKEKFSKFRKDERRKRYATEIKELYPYCCISLFSDVSEGEMSGEEVIKDESIFVEETAILNVLLEKLRNALRFLSTDEMLLIQSLYLDKPRLSQNEYAAKQGVSQQAVSKQHLAVLRKLKELL